jgi:hypothetical protein
LALLLLGVRFSGQTVRGLVLKSFHIARQFGCSFSLCGSLLCIMALVAVIDTHKLSRGETK